MIQYVLPAVSAVGPVPFVQVNLSLFTNGALSFMTAKAFHAPVPLSEAVNTHEGAFTPRLEWKVRVMVPAPEGLVPVVATIVPTLTNKVQQGL